MKSHGGVAFSRKVATWLWVIQIVGSFLLLTLILILVLQQNARTVGAAVQAARHNRALIQVIVDEFEMHRSRNERLHHLLLCSAATDPADARDIKRVLPRRELEEALELCPGLLTRIFPRGSNGTETNGTTFGSPSPRQDEKEDDGKGGGGKNGGPPDPEPPQDEPELVCLPMTDICVTRPTLRLAALFMEEE